ncbi:MAG: hypothetical protein ACOCUI_04155 [bacterium]
MRERGLKRDKSDDKAFRQGRDRYVGYTFEQEFFQYMPFFFSSEGNVDYVTVGNYRGAHAFLICGGPSFGELDHSKLDNCLTMSLNNGVKTYRPDLWTCVDQSSRFLKSIWLDPKIKKFVPFDHTENELWDNTVNNWGPLYLNKEKNKVMKVRNCPNILFYRRNEKFEPSRWLFEYTFNWGDHSKWGGGRSVMLVALKILFILGIRNVYLLGCDLHMDENTKYHFDENRTKGAQKGNMNTYKKMIEVYFPKLKPYFDDFGYNVYNCNPDSRLKVFPYLPYDEAIKRATENLNIKDEISCGMYRKYEEKMQNLEKDRDILKSGRKL